MSTHAATQGSSGNVIAAVCSFFLPGLGQLCQGRPFTAVFHFVLDLFLWPFFLGWVMHLWSAFSAATYER